jgi:hypothetical protein
VDKRDSFRTLCAVDIEVTSSGVVLARGSLIDVSRTGLKIRYLTAAAVGRLAVGDPVRVTGSVATGTFALVGRVERLEPVHGEIGVSIQGGEVDALLALLGSPIAGTPGPPDPGSEGSSGR